jgi:hypothetical protein
MSGWFVKVEQNMEWERLMIYGMMGIVYVQCEVVEQCYACTMLQ